MQNKFFDSTTLAFFLAALILFILIYIKNLTLAISSTKSGLNVF